MALEDRDFQCWLHELRLTERSRAILDAQGMKARDVFYESKDSLQFLLAEREKDYEKIVAHRSIDKLKAYLKQLDNLQIQWVTMDDPNYPEPLKFIDNSPVLLYFKGRLEIKDFDYGIAVVGSRKSSHYGKWACRELASSLTKSGLTIFSGMALGIDSIAHQAALEAGGRTIAVLGSGLEHIYPRKHVALAGEIIENGALISEYPPFLGPKPYHFPERNRIISGLTKGTIVIEAQEKSGSLITARLAAEQGKEVFAVPGNIDSLFSRGTNKLILDGAIPLLETNQVLDLFENLVEKNSKQLDLSRYDKDEKALIALIKEGPKTVEELTLTLKLPTSHIMAKLTLLEMEGTIEEGSGGIFRLRG